MWKKICGMNPDEIERYGWPKDIEPDKSKVGFVFDGFLYPRQTINSRYVPWGVDWRDPVLPAWACLHPIQTEVTSFRSQIWILFIQPGLH